MSAGIDALEETAYGAVFAFANRECIDHRSYGWRDSPLRRWLLRKG